MYTHSSKITQVLNDHSRRRTGLFVTGTDTGVGKTQVTGGIAAAAAKRYPTETLQLWKPVQTGVQYGEEDADSNRLMRLSGFNSTEREITPITLPDPLAPWMASERAGHELDYTELVQEGIRRAEQGTLIVEGAGGLLVPLTSSHTIADLAGDLGLPVLIVARARLGTVNHTLLTIDALKQRNLRIAGVIVNGVMSGDERSTVENRRMIEHFGEVPVIGELPWQPEPVWSAKSPYSWLQWRTAWIETLERAVDWDRLWHQVHGT